MAAAVQGVVVGGRARLVGVVIMVLGGVIALKSAFMLSSEAKIDDRRDIELSRRSVSWLLGNRHQAGAIFFVALGGVLALTAYSFGLNSELPVNYRSAYDGIDPYHAGCTGDPTGKGTVLASSAVIYRNMNLGILDLEYSPLCGSHWGRFAISSLGLQILKGSELTLVATRPADNTQAMYSQLVGRHPGLYLYGNMVGGGVCGEATIAGFRRGQAFFSVSTVCRTS
jgi:hypothetical protein